ncbi:MAG: hypothetical protein AUG51_21795 [Acidobacteria bacterium 13_1_20CM_3_53_8]|nr:MAG: hypothetical protein AUG51_21795 [Acidobacteria bacterium 13_1_20CM_3_53_8]
MFFLSKPAHTCVRAPRFRKHLFVLFTLALLVCAAPPTASAQSLERELGTPERVTVSIRNRNGRVTVISSDEQQKKVTIKATSPGAAVAEADVRSTVAGETVEIDVRARSERDRIDLTVRVPAKAKVKVLSEAGAVDVMGDVAAAEVSTTTGTIHTDVPLDAADVNLLWQTSRPRFLSDVTLPKVSERAGGTFLIKGKLGDPHTKKTERVRLDLTTERGVMLINVDPNMVPSDLRERQLTEAARAIVRSGNSDLIDAIRKVSPRFFGDYEQTLPAHQIQPTLASHRSSGTAITSVAQQLVRVNASVTDRHGRAIGGLSASDFTVFENGQERKVTEVAPTSAPFNLVLLLDVSGSVEDRIDFIRKAARDFLSTVSPQDRIAIISFRDDIQVISNFTTDRRLLFNRLNDIQAGGGTALYDALAYVLVDTLKPLRGERTAVVVMSDGDDNKSFVPFPSVLEALIESGALVYPLYVPSGLIPESSVPQPSLTLDPLRTRYLTITSRAAEEGQRLADASGGLFYSIRRIEDLQKAYDDVVTQLRTAYTITYLSNAGTTSERRIKIHANREGAMVRLSTAVNVATP